ncbi:hypothetical protein BJ085DRAFT_4272, partial [Dimargaris cristalligena]
FDPEWFVTSNLVSPRVLLIIRLLLFMFALGTLIAMFVANSYRFFYYMTCWSFFGLTIYFGLATYVSARYCSGPLRYTELANPLYRASSLTRAGYWFLYESMVTFHLLVPIIYWSLLRDTFITSVPLYIYTGLASHAADLAVIAVEVLLNRQRLQLSHIIVPLLIMALYLGLAYTVWGARGIFVYPFLNFQRLHGWVAAIMLALVVFCSVLFLFQYVV